MQGIHKKKIQIQILLVVLVTMAAINPLDRIINIVRLSNLNFAYQETPYSLYLTIRKTTVKNHQASSVQSSQGNFHHDVETLERENLSLKRSNLELEDKLSASKETTKILDEKIAVLEAETLKAFNQTKVGKDSLARKDDEIKCLKNVIENNNATIKNLQTNKSELNKITKKKEKEVYDVEKANQAHQNTIKTLKDEVQNYKGEKNELHKKNKQMEKKVEMLEVKLNTVTNNNIPSTK